MLGQDVGFPVPVGGAGRLAEALVSRLSAHGGEVICGQRVTAIDVRAGRAVGVRTADGTAVAARRAVLADVSAPALYGRLLDPHALPARVHRGMRRFQWDPGTVKVDWALDGPVPWRGTPAAAPGTVHLADSDEHLARWMTQVMAGAVPDDPFLLVGQMTTADPSRSPVGTEALWAYTRVPRQIRSDAATGGTDAIRGGWDADDARRMADRMQDRIERFAPGFARTSSPGAFSPPPICRRATPTSTAARSAVVPRACTNSLFSGRSPGGAGPRLPSPGCTWPRPRRIPVAACTVPAEPMQRARPWPTPACRSGRDRFESAAAGHGSGMTIPDGPIVPGPTDPSPAPAPPVPPTPEPPTPSEPGPFNPDDPGGVPV